jgi:quinol monooxygenase YgiN
MPHVLLVDFRIKRDFIDAFERAILQTAGDSLAFEPGCRQFDVCRDPADDTRFVLYEVYDDEAAAAEHLRAPHYLRMCEAAAGWLDSKRIVPLTCLDNPRVPA